MLTTSLAMMALALNVVSAADYTYPNCAIVTFGATATASNLEFPLNVTDPKGLNDTINHRIFHRAKPFTLTSKIVARYCEPEKKDDKKKDQLQFLLHSITNNKNFWSGLGEPGKGFQGDDYSWIAYASKRGYATLSLDRLGNGQSDHPDPLLVVQGPYEYALYHEIIQQIKSGENSPLPRTFSDIIPVSNSYGSVIVDNMLALYPDDVSKAILTGYTGSALSSFPGIIAVVPLPAFLAIPERFFDLPLLYLTTTSEDGRRGAFYGLPPHVTFPYDITVLDNQVRDVVSIGQFLSNYLMGATLADKYKGRVLVLTGEKDNAFCGPGNLLVEGILPFFCGAKIPDTGLLFPNADFNWYSVDKTGHSLFFHDSKDEIFQVAHDFLEGAKYNKTGHP